MSEVTSRLGERASPQRERVETLARRCSFSAQARNLTFGLGVASLKREGLA